MSQVHSDTRSSTLVHKYALLFINQCDMLCTRVVHFWYTRDKCTRKICPCVLLCTAVYCLCTRVVHKISSCFLKMLPEIVYLTLSVGKKGWSIDVSTLFC